MSTVDRAHIMEGRVTDIPESRQRSYTSSSSDSCLSPSEDSPSPTLTATSDDPMMIKDYSSMPLEAGNAPALPDKSSKRASRFLAPAPPTKSNGLPKSGRLHLTTTPYDMYLSSEEDVSSSADDFSDFDDESDKDQTLQTPPRNTATTARVVSVVFHGKPNMIQLTPRSKRARASGAAPIQRAETDPALARRLSMASTLSSPISYPPRSSSRKFVDSRLPKQPLFLGTDPFVLNKGEEIERPKTPLTPTSMFKRGLSMVKKRSRTHMAHPSIYSRDNMSVQTLPSSPEEEYTARQRQMSDSPIEAKSPLYYQEMMKSARSRTLGLPASDTASVMSHNTANLHRLRAGLSMSKRRNSIKS